MIYITSEMLIQILIFVLVFAITFQIFLKLVKEKVFAGIISLVISILATISLTYYQIDFIAQSYTLFGMIMLISIPFLIIFFFIYALNLQSLTRKMLLATYGVMSLIVLNQNQTVNLELKNTITFSIIITISLVVIFDKWIKEKLESRKNLRR